MGGGQGGSLCVFKSLHFNCPEQNPLWTKLLWGRSAAVSALSADRWPGASSVLWQTNSLAFCLRRKAVFVASAAAVPETGADAAFVVEEPPDRVIHTVASILAEEADACKRWQERGGKISSQKNKLNKTEQKNRRALYCHCTCAKLWALCNGGRKYINSKGLQEYIADRSGSATFNTQRAVWTQLVVTIVHGGAAHLRLWIQRSMLGLPGVESLDKSTALRRVRLFWAMKNTNI